MTQAEFATWRHYRQWNGFALDRLEHTIANAGAAAARNLRVSPNELVARFRPAGAKATNESRVAGMSSIAGAQVTVVQRKK